MAYSSINQKSLDRCKQFVFGKEGRGERQRSAVQPVRVEKMLRVHLELGAEYMHTKEAGDTAEPGGSERGAFSFQSIFLD